jgi:hypothetical protein
MPERWGISSDIAAHGEPMSATRAMIGPGATALSDQARSRPYSSLARMTTRSEELGAVDSLDGTS